MALLTIGRMHFEARLVAFDKDGTLIGFEPLWGRIARAWAEQLAAGADGGRVRREILRSWGYDELRGLTLPQSPLAIASNSQLLTIAAATLYRLGVPWPEAEDRARAAWESVQGRPDLSLARLLRPAGNVVALAGRLRRAGVQVAIVTTDDRSSTQQTTRLLGIADLVDAMVCGDDGLPTKPAPDMLLAACQRLGVEPRHAAVVGDTEVDLLMAERAGAGLRVAVLSGVGDPGLLARYADVVIDTIDEIKICDDSEGGSAP